MKSITIIAPDDWHIHLRDDDALYRTVSDVAQQFERAVCMPNLTPPVTNLEQAIAYQQRILAHVPTGLNFEPLMVLYLTDFTTAQEVEEAFLSGVVKAVKVYPAGATTNSHSGVTNLIGRMPIFETMQRLGMPLLIHGEVTDKHVDIFDREKQFIDQHLRPLIKALPQLKIVLEHITTKDAVDFVLEMGEQVAATITPQHLMFNRNDMLVGGIRPHLYCLPILKRHVHQQALIKAATSGNKKFFLGTDSAPHERHKKESACGCAGCYSAPYALAMYAEVFEQQNALHLLEGFASIYGAHFYGLPLNTNQITLIKKQQVIATELPYIKDDVIIPLSAGNTLSWQIQQ